MDLKEKSTLLNKAYKKVVCTLGSIVYLIKINPVLHSLSKPGLGKKIRWNTRAVEQWIYFHCSYFRSEITLLYTILMWEAVRDCRLQNDVIYFHMYRSAINPLQWTFFALTQFACSCLCVKGMTLDSTRCKMLCSGCCGHLWLGNSESTVYLRCTAFKEKASSDPICVQGFLIKATCSLFKPSWQHI